MINASYKFVNYFSVTQVKSYDIDVLILIIISDVTS